MLGAPVFHRRLLREAREVRALSLLRTAAIGFAAAALPALWAQWWSPHLTLLGWALAAAASFSTAILAGFLPSKAAEEVAQHWDRRTGESALAATAWHGLQARPASHFLPLLHHRADEFARTLPPSQRLPDPPVAVVLGMMAVCLAGALMLRKSSHSSHPHAPTEGPSSALLGVASEAPGIPAEDLEAHALARYIRLQISVDPEVAHLGDELTLLLRGLPLAPVEAEIPLAFFLVATNGQPCPDAGFGSGWRVLRLNTRATLAATAPPAFQDLIDLRAALLAQGLHERGLISMFVAARGPDRALGYVRSNDVTIQISDNVERSRAPVPSGVGTTKESGTEKPEQKEKPPTARTGTEPPKLGSEDRLKDAVRQAAAVRPLLSDGPRVEKEVSVFDSEAGAARTTRPADPPAEKVHRTFDRAAETTMPELRLSPSDRALLAKYFAALRRRG